MKKTLLILFLIFLLAGLYSAWKVFGPTVSAPENKYFYVRTGAGYDEVKTSLLDQKIIPGAFFFNLVSKQVKYNQNIKAGRYEIRNGSSIVNLVRILKAGRQSPVRFVINKLRTKEDFAGKAGQQFEFDSTEVMNFITSNDSLAKYHFDTNTVMTAIIPNSYLFWWNVSFKNMFTRFTDQQKKFWDGKRSQKAAALNFTPTQVYTIASIVEEETNRESDKGLVASVYINRLKKGMKLEADPTVKYAMRDFGLKRILHGHLDYPSLYNTYQHTGLPPGPICTASINTIDAVLDAPQTNYIYFVAKPDFNGYSNFAATYPEHLVFANAYRRALDSLILIRNK
ncbi:MAG: endolytic transglycosylase MltG [Ferruginibacter sp.]